MASGDKFCWSCGSSLFGNDKFCRECGADLKPPESAADDTHEKPTPIKDGSIENNTSDFGTPDSEITRRKQLERYESREQTGSWTKKETPQDLGSSHSGYDEQFCPHCGAVIKTKAEICPKCGVRVKEPSKKSFWAKKRSWIIAACMLVMIIAICTPASEESSSGQNDTNVTSTQSQTKTKVTATATSTPVPIFFSDELASSFLLEPNDFPKNWTAKTNGLFLEAQNDFLTDFNAQIIKITLETYASEAAAQTAFSTQKSDAQATVNSRGISGDKLEDIKKYPLFIWNASGNANVQGAENWTVIGVYGNLTVNISNTGSVGAPRKDFAIDIAKKQIDRISGD